MKYIIVKEHDILWPIIFPEHLNHCDLVPNNLSVSQVFSAGYCNIEDDNVITWGKSVSLKDTPSKIKESREIIQQWYDYGDSTQCIFSQQFLENNEH